MPAGDDCAPAESVVRQLPQEALQNLQARPRRELLGCRPLLVRIGSSLVLQDVAESARGQAGQLLGGDAAKPRLGGGRRPPRAAQEPRAGAAAAIGTLVPR